MIVVDASVWVSYFWLQDVNHAATHQWVRTYLGSGQRMMAPLLLLVEVGGALTRRTGQAPGGRRAMQNLIRLPLLRWVPQDAGLMLHAGQLACDLQLRGAGAVYVAAADRLQIPLMSWDCEHLMRASQQITVHSPATTPV